MVELAKPHGAGEANIASSELSQDGNLRISFHRGAFADEAALNRAAYYAAYVIHDIQVEAITFRRACAMTQPDFEQAQHYALDRLERELSPKLVYHSLRHTRDDVLPAAERLAPVEGVAGEELLLLRTAAVYHDIGFVKQRVDHEDVGARIAAEVLPRFGYNPAHIAAIGGMIMATKLPQSSRTLLEKILADADLDVLGRDDFLTRNQDLRAELAAYGTLATDEQWYTNQLKFLEGHRYFTAAARSLRDPQKQKNIAALRVLLAKAA